MQPLNITRLLAAIEKKKAPHAILITGPEGGNACAFAKLAAAFCCIQSKDPALLGDCPDYLELGPVSIGVDDIRSMQTALHMRAFSGMRAAVILEAHHMTEAAQNALLKTLEEPPENVTLLLCGQESGLLPTIRSRCTILRLGAEPEEATLLALERQGVASAAAKLATRIAQGAPLLAESMATPAYQTFFEQSADALIKALTAPLPPYAEVFELIKTNPIPPQNAPRTQTEERRQAAKHLLNNWLAILQDALYQKLFPPGARGLKHAKTLAERFTIKQIQGMIELILSAQIRVGAASPQLTIDHLLTAVGGFGRDKQS